MSDYLIRVITTNKEIRALAVRSTNIVEKARKAHNTSPVATAALGRSLSGAVLMGSMIKAGEETGLIIEGDGPLKRIIIESNQKGEVRGYVSNPNVDLMVKNNGKLDVAKAIGQGQLRVIKRKLLKEPYESSIPLISGEIGEDLTYYFTQSEQTPSAVGVGVLLDKDNSVTAAGGFIVQLLPGATDETISQLERNIGKISAISKMIEDGKVPEDILKHILEGFDFRIMARKDVMYKCKCDRKRIISLIQAMDKEEIKDIIETEGKIEVKCHFCNDIYKFKENDIRELISE
ncbi:Hsp33 family molecular chaperone HslO [Natronospora cellulosivora (SeqCode)]